MKTLQVLRKLNHVKRCSLFPLIHPTSVSEHSFHVSLISIFLIEKLKEEGKKFDELKIIKEAILHDIEEVVVSDIPTTVKKHLKDCVEEALHNMINEELPDAPKWFLKYILEPDNNTVESMIVKISDLIELSHYCIDEMGLGNKHVSVMLERVIVRMKSVNNDLLSEYIREVIKDLEVYYEKNK